MLNCKRGVDRSYAVLTSQVWVDGFFAVIGYGRQSVVKKTQIAFSTYINREHIENHFRAEKLMLIRLDPVKTIKQSIRNDINQSKIDNRGKALAGKKQKLLTWLDSMSLQDILSWFDAIEMTEVSSQIKARRWNTEVLERDRMFLQMLGVEINT